MTTTPRHPVMRPRALALAAGAVLLAVPGSAHAATSTGGAAAVPASGKGAGGVVYGTKTVTKATPSRTTVKTTKARSVARPRSASSRNVFLRLGSRLPLKTGMHGTDVKALQKRLSILGQQVVADGSFGKATATALSAWETTAGRTSDGELDATDLTTMSSAITTALGTSTAPVAPPLSPLTATIGLDGLAVAPLGAPPQVAAFIAAGNVIAKTPYVWGGGHGKWDDVGYDCSGSVSYALHGAGLLDTTMDSTMLESYGQAGVGPWITIYANADHTFVVIAGIRFDTSGQRQAGTRWQPLATRSSYTGYVVRHPVGL